MEFKNLEKFDPEVYELIKQEEEKQQNKINLIPSENFSIPAVREALASVFVHKYAEGQVNKRYYEGNQYVDQIEQICKDRVRAFFRLPDDWNVNVQALAGSNANLGVYNGLLQAGDTILSMYLPDGGHLSHGWSFAEEGESIDQADAGIYLGGSRKVSLVSKFFNVVQYKVNPETRIFDYDKIRDVAKKYQPKMIISGGTAYPREIDYKALADIAHEVSAYYLSDISHEAGLVGAGAVNSPIDIADVVTFTTHKTLRGPRGAVIVGKEDLMKQIDFGVFPGLQGGPFEHCIASIAVALKDAQTDEFKTYAKQIVTNAQRMAAKFMQLGYDVVSGGADKHLVLIDMRSKNMSGRNPSTALDIAGLILNRNSVPNETGNPMNPSGIRMGTPTVTTRGMKEPEMDQIVIWIDQVIKFVEPHCGLKPKAFYKQVKDMPELKAIADEVQALCGKFPVEI